MRKHFNFLGFKINTKNFLISLAVFAGIFLLLVIIDEYFKSVSWYGFLIGCAFLLAVVLAGELMPERGLSKDFPYTLIWWVFPFTVVGARLAFVLSEIDYYNSFFEVIAIWKGGLSLYGGIIGGVIGLLICCAIKRVNPISAMDVSAPVLILGQSIGRWGNFINGEVYGWEITNKSLQWFPFGVKIDGVWHLANFFYESVLNFGGFLLLLYILRKSKQKGVVLSSYCVYYGIVRLFLEGLREPEFIMLIPGTSIEWSRLMSCVIILVGIVGLIITNIVKNKRYNKK